jgi:hypothetical protein
LWPSLVKVLEVLIHPPPLLGVTRFLQLASALLAREVEKNGGIRASNRM